MITKQISMASGTVVLYNSYFGYRYTFMIKLFLRYSGLSDLLPFFSV